MLCPRATRRARLDTITKTKTVQLHQQTIDVIDADRQMAERLYPVTPEAMRSGLYVPDRGLLLRSRRYGGFWERCVREYGGELE